MAFRQYLIWLIFILACVKEKTVGKLTMVNKNELQKEVIAARYGKKNHWPANFYLCLTRKLYESRCTIFGEILVEIISFKMGDGKHFDFLLDAFA